MNNLNTDNSTEIQKIRKKYPDHIPFYIYTNDKSLRLAKNKFLAPKNFSFGQIIHVIRKNINVSQTEALFFFVNKSLVPTSTLISQIYEEYNQNGILTFLVCKENTFG